MEDVNWVLCSFGGKGRRAKRGWLVPVTANGTISEATAAQ